MTQLTQIQIEGYKSIRSLDLELHPMNVVIGANGAGKSNLISFLQLLQSHVKRSLQSFVAEQNGASHIFYYGSEQTGVLSATLEFNNDRKYSITFEVDAQNQLIIKSETSIDISIDSIYEKVADWQFYRFHQANDSFSVVTQLRDIYVSHPKHYKRIIATLRQILPFFDDFIWTQTNDHSESISESQSLCFYWREKGSSMTFNTRHMSDGMVRMISLITLLLQPKLPSLICIDEPELGLHPYAINVIAALLQTVALETQLIVSTQSVTLLNEFDILDIVVVNRKDGQSAFERLHSVDFTNWLQEYTLGELWEKNILGGRPS